MKTGFLRLLHELDADQSGHADVRDHDIGLQEADHLKCLLPVVDTPDNLHAEGGPVHQILDELDDFHFVVSNKYFQHRFLLNIS